MNVPLDVPLYSNYITGWRVWRWYPATQLLGAISSSVTWPPGRMMRAECSIAMRRKSPHSFDGCTCGLYASNKLVDCRRLTSYCFYGEVALWGQVAVHEHGYRAEYAYPLTIYIPLAWEIRASSSLTRTQEALSRYGVPVFVESILLRQELENFRKNGIIFGSRFFGTHKPSSDTIETLLQNRGFIELTLEYSYKDS